MACLPSSSKCEWLEIREFVAHFNKETGSNYSYKCCLDVEIRDSKQPEVRCLDGNSELVIERKNFMWLLNYAQIHNTEHRIFDGLSKAIAIDASEAMQLCVPEISEFNPVVIDKEVEIIAKAISEYSKKLKYGQAVRLSHKFGEFQLLREHPNSREDGQPATGMSYLTNEMSIDEIVDSSDIPESLVSNTQKLIDGASAKFVNYQSAKKYYSSIL